MPPKNARADAAAKQKAKEEEREETLQAVTCFEGCLAGLRRATESMVLADSFERKFAPFSLERPRCLILLANVPLIEYTLEFLANSGVEHVFVYCGAHVDQVESYINASKWKLNTSPFKSCTVLKSAATSAGDAMRDLDTRDLITGDFLLVSGDVISNVPIEPILVRHRARREKDKNAIMTMVLREAGRDHRTKRRGRRPVFVINPTTDRCLHYEEIPRRPGKAGRYLEIDTDLLSMHDEIELREDLIDCYIDICTPDVLGLWSDNFDYQSVRTSFLFGVLKDYELNGKTIHTEILTDHYAARVRSLHAYDAVSKDIISRWTYPLCPDSNILEGQSYRQSRGKVYSEAGVVLARSSLLKRRAVVGAKTSIGDGSVISDSIIGRHCQIGRNVVIESSYIWDNVSIGDNTIITKAVIADEASIGDRCIVEAGALISYRVRIANEKIVPGTSRITNYAKLKSEEELPSRSPSADVDLVGKGGEGYAYASDSDSATSQTSHSSQTSSSSHLYSPPLSRSASASSISTLSSTTSSFMEGDSALSASHADISVIPLTTSSSTTSLQETSAATQAFHLDASTSILDGLVKSEAPDVIHLELLGQRLGSNADDHSMRAALVSAFMQRVWQLIDGGDAPANDEDRGGGSNTNEKKATVSEAVKATFGTYVDLLRQLGIFDTAKEEKKDQVDLLGLCERECSSRMRNGGDKADQVLVFAVRELWEREVLQEEGVLQWWSKDVDKEKEREKEGRVEDAEREKVRGLVGKFVEFLEEDEDEDEDESEEEEDEEEEEEEDDE
ncbi:hypothetical protein MMC25_001418 [Agyrium rufum]|nr:hypothetical protein [Agyrium rufum]